MADGTEPTDSPSGDLALEPLVGERIEPLEGGAEELERLPVRLRLVCVRDGRDAQELLEALDGGCHRTSLLAGLPPDRRGGIGTTGRRSRTERGGRTGPGPSL